MKLRTLAVVSLVVAGCGSEAREPAAAHEPATSADSTGESDEATRLAFEAARQASLEAAHGPHGADPRATGASPHGGAGGPLTESAGGVAWHAPEPFVPSPPTSSMRLLQYTPADHDGAELVVFHFPPGQGGSVDDNVDRWLGQFTQPDGRPTREVATVDRGESNGVHLTRVDASGTFAGMRPSGETSTASNQRLIGLIAEGPAGLVVFKLTGPADVVGDLADEMESLASSLHPE